MPTLAELDARLTLRLGDVGGGNAWTSEEKKLVLNVAQVECAKDLHQRGREWSTRMRTRLSVIDGAEYYLMPDDFMLMQKIAHFYPTHRPRRLRKGAVVDIQFNSYEADRGYDSRYVYYEMSGRESPFISIGTAEEGSDGTNLVDTAGDFAAAGVRVNDLVHNVNDGSNARVAGFSSGFIQLDSWRGGASQRFYVGQSYRIQRPERTLYQMFVWPIVQVASPVVYEGSPVSFTVSADANVQSIYFQVTGVPSDWELDDIVSVSLYADGTLVPTARWGQQQVLVGYNRLLALEPFLMRQDTTYELRFAGGATIGNVRIEQNNDNFLLLNYVALPAPLAAPESITEFPDEYIEPLLDYAKLLASDKRYPNGEYHQSHLNRYNQSVARSKEFRVSAEESEPAYVDEDSAGYYYESNPGYTERFGDVSALL